MTSARFYHLSETMHAPEHLDHQPDIRAPSSARLRANSVRSTVSPASAKQNYEGPGRTGPASSGQPLPLSDVALLRAEDRQPELIVIRWLPGRLAEPGTAGSTGFGTTLSSNTKFLRLQLRRRRLHPCPICRPTHRSPVIQDSVRSPERSQLWAPVSILLDRRAGGQHFRLGTGVCAAYPDAPGRRLRLDIAHKTLERDPILQGCVQGKPGPLLRWLQFAQPSLQLEYRRRVRARRAIESAQQSLSVHPSLESRHQCYHGITCRGTVSSKAVPTMHRAGSTLKLITPRSG